eukprot:m.69716 g.69716  ORF g.69716 m.69716 type:complete len:300 (-) comp16044_c0_seq3:252-1151(-)
MVDRGELQKMSPKDLKHIIAKAGLSASDCVEKSDLVERALEACNKTATSAQNGSDGKRGLVSGSSVDIGDFNCKILGTKGKPDGVVVILHGYGATSADFAPVCPILEKSIQNKSLRFVLPQALRLRGIPAWWDIDVQEWISLNMSPDQSKIATLLRKPHQGLEKCRQQMSEMLDCICNAEGIRHNQIVICGFSQGAMTAIDTSLWLPAEKRVAGIVSISGAPIVVDQWAQNAQKHPKLPVLATHGRTDMVLPFQVSGWLVDLLKTNGLEVETFFHEQGHTLGPQPVIKLMIDFITKTLS